MIFGELNFKKKNFSKNNLNLELFLSKKENLFYFNEYIFNLKLYYVLNKNLPYKPDNILKVNKENKIFFIKYGNIYNHYDLKKRYDLIEGLSELDLTEFLFLSKGENFVNEINGDFLIIIYDAEKNSLLIFRDHLGVYPLAFSVTEDSLIFTSDVSFLCKEIQIHEINFEPLLTDFRFIDFKQTVNKNVNKLLPGHFLKYENGKVRIIKYWEPEKIKTNYSLTQDQVFSELKFLVEDAVHIRADKRFNAAAHISGGLDSSLIGALARKEYKDQKNFYGYSWSPVDFEVEDVEFDERKLIKDVCDKHSIEPIFINLTFKDYFAFSKNYIRNFGAFYEEKVIEHAKSQSVNLIFSGWGGDEFLSKGSSGTNLDLILNINLKLFFKRNPIYKFRNLIKVFVYEVLFPLLNIINPSFKRNHKRYTKYIKFPFNQYYKKSVKNYFCFKSRRALHLGYLYDYHIPERTERFFINGFYKGIEYRYPLLDKRIVEYMLKVPSHLLVSKEFDRLIIRKISAGILPDEIRFLRKGADPVLLAKAQKLGIEVCKVFVNELEDFKSNPDLFFIDFDLLESDLEKFKAGQLDDDFIGSVYSIKMLHEFTKRFRDRRSLLETDLYGE